MSLSDRDVDVPGWAVGVLLLSGTVSVAGLTDYLLTNAGYGILGTAVWGLCYATALAVIWIVWLQDIELIGPENG